MNFNMFFLRFGKSHTFCWSRRLQTKKQWTKNHLKDFQIPFHAWLVPTCNYSTSIGFFHSWVINFQSMEVLKETPKQCCLCCSWLRSPGGKKLTQINTRTQIHTEFSFLAAGIQWLCSGVSCKRISKIMQRQSKKLVS